MRGPGMSMTARAESKKAAYAFDLAIVGTVGVPGRYGGFETLADQLTQRLHQDFRILVCCTSAGRTAPLPENYLGATLRYFRWEANGWQSIPYDIASLFYAAPRSRAVLVLGVSGCLLLPLIRLRSPRTRIVTNIDGLEWKRRKWGRLARLVLRLSEWSAVRFSDAVVADNPAIQEHVRRSYGMPSGLIYYGGDHMHRSGSTAAAVPLRFERGTYVLGVCRIEPENNVREILLAFQAAPKCRLVMVGNWTVSGYAQGLRHDFGALENIELLDPIYEEQRLDDLRRGARAYVHGHSAGGTNPSLVEAMTAGMPVLAFDVDYNRHTTDGQALYWSDPEALTRLIESVGPAELAANAAAMTEIAARRYCWTTVSRQYQDILFPVNVT
jgi:glycosyltransferase involved in cell wall biosynthesis